MRTRHLEAVAGGAGCAPDSDTADVVDGRGLPMGEPWASQVASWARAADSTAGVVEHSLEALRCARVDLLGQHPGSAGQRLAAVMTELEAAAAVLGEMHGGLDELAHQGPGGAA